MAIVRDVDTARDTTQTGVVSVNSTVTALQSILSGIRTNRIKIATFAIAGMAAGLAAAISVSRISMGQPGAGIGMELQAIAAVILGGTSIYGGSGAVWRSVAGVLLLANKLAAVSEGVEGDRRSVVAEPGRHQLPVDVVHEGPHRGLVEVDGAV